MKEKDSQFFKLALLISCATHFLFFIIFPGLKMPLIVPQKPLEATLIRISPARKPVQKSQQKVSAPKPVVKKISRPSAPKLPSRNLPKLISEKLANLPPRVKSESFIKIPLSPPEFKPSLKKEEKFIPPLLEENVIKAKRFSPEKKGISPKVSPLIKEEFSYGGKVVGYKSEVVPSQIKGPVAGRGILRSKDPTYPEWAERQGVKGKVVLKFWVLPGGEVSNIELQRTSGWSDLDECAIEALKKWRFEPIEKKIVQWGIIPFKFEL